MPLPSPILDDRSYQQLRDELIRRIPVYAPEWTDHNPSDPGITLLELFAYLGESLLYRFNQIPEATKLAFLQLLQIPLRSAVSARAVLQLATEVPDGVLVPINPTKSEAKAGKIPFEIETECMVWPLDAQIMARTGSSGPTAEENVSVLLVKTALGLSANAKASYYKTEPLPADPAAPGAKAIDFGNTVDGTMWIAVLAVDATDPAKLADQALNFAVVLDDVVPSMDQIEACPGAGFQEPTPLVTWQISTPGDPKKPPVYRDLTVIGDTTRGFSRSGIVRVRLPRDVTTYGVPLLSDPDKAGAGDYPPLVEDEEVAEKILFWIRAFRQDKGDLPVIRWVGINAVDAVQAKTARPEYLGTGDAQPDQRYKLINAQVMPGTLVIEVEETAGQWTRWTEVDGFHASTESDRHFALDSEAGQVRFGNGVQGQTPQLGRRIRASTYRYGGGRAGNVAAGAISALVSPGDVTVKNPLPARGGEDAEEIAAALDRIPAEFRRHDRAVCAGDFQELALATPGADVGRAEVLPLFDPRNTALEQAPGVVSVVVWPKQDARNPAAPMPDQTLLDAVCAYLDSRRLVTTELYVIPPTYRKIAVSIGISVKPGYGVEAVRRWVELVVRQYLAPLPPYGPSGQGWPLGRRVHSAELVAAALQVEGVEFLEGLELAPINANGSAGASVEIVTLQPWEVPELGVDSLSVVPGEPLEPGEQSTPPEPADPPVPIPIIREEC